MTAASAAIAALLARERRGGGGQRVDVPMLDAFAAYMLPDLVIPEAFVPAEPRTEGGLNIYNTYETKDGHVVGIVLEDRQFVGLARALDREDLIDRPEYKTLIDRITRADELLEILRAEILKWTTEEIVTRARANEAPFGPVNDVTAFFEDPQVVHNRTFFEADDPRAGGAKYLRHPSRFSETPASLRRHPPRLGEHTDEILSAAGHSTESIASLREDGSVL
jgi:crotonobetainyl-CoA:carnitine CoA-transferase CaiB-like acyl-CoA transferase